MQDQRSNQIENQVVSQTFPPLQRITYRDSNKGIRQDELNPTLTEVATDMEQHYQPLERLHDVGLHGWGIAAGLQVAFLPHQVGVTVRPGIALDSNGLHILLVAGGQADISLQSDGPGTQPPVPVNNNGVLVPTTGLTGDQFLVIRFFEVVDNAHFCTHTPWVHFVTLADLPTDGSSIILAQITFDSGSNAGQVLTVSQNVRQSVHRHIEQAHEFMTQGPAVVTGPSVSATLNSVGITVSPGLALDSTGRYISLSSGGQAEVGPNADAPGAAPTLVNVNDSGVLIPTNGLTGFKFLTIQHWETPATVILPLPPNTQQAAPFSFRYTPRFQFVDGLSQSFDPPSIVLASVAFSTDASGSVAGLTQDDRGIINLGVSGIDLLKTTNAGNQLISTSVAGGLGAAPDGLFLTVANTSDEIQVLSSDNGQNLAKISLGANRVVARSLDRRETVVINPNIGSISGTSFSAIGNINSASVSTTNLSATNLTATGQVGVGLSNPRTQLHVLGRISTGRDGESPTSPGAITFFPPDGFAWFHIDNGPAGGRPTGRLRFSFGVNPGDNEVMSIDQGRNVKVLGSFSVTGQKNFVQDHPADATKQIVYVSLEGGEAGTYIRGTGTLIDGKAVVELPEHFRLVTHQQGLTVQLTPRGEWLQLYVVELNTSQVVIREAQGKNGEFDYFVQGIRAGHEEHQVIQDKE